MSIVTYPSRFMYLQITSINAQVYISVYVFIPVLFYELFLLPNLSQLKIEELLLSELCYILNYKIKNLARH